MKVLNVFFFLTAASSVSARGLWGERGGTGGAALDEHPPASPPEPGSWMVPAAQEATGTVPGHSAGKMSPRPHWNCSLINYHVHKQLATTTALPPPLPRGQRPGSPPGAGQEPAGSRDPSGKLPGAVAPRRCPTPGLDEPLGLGAALPSRAKPWLLGRHLVRVEAGGSRPLSC